MIDESSTNNEYTKRCAKRITELISVMSCLGVRPIISVSGMPVAGISEDDDMKDASFIKAKSMAAQKALYDLLDSKVEYYLAKMRAMQSFGFNEGIVKEE